MAAAMAARALSGVAEVRSDGVEACGKRASSKTVALLQRRHGIDVSSHRSRDIEGFSLEGFDYIVAMRPEYTKRLKREFKVPNRKIITWDVEDPLIKGTDMAYEKCLAEIEQLLNEFLETIKL